MVYTKDSTLKNSDLISKMLIFFKILTGKIKYSMK